MDRTFPPALKAGIAQVLGNIVEARPVTQHGYTPTQRWIVTFDHGASLFIKWATDDDTARELAVEREVYELLGETHFAPRYFGYGQAQDATERLRPFLALEDLSHCQWLPPWSPESVQGVQDVLREVRAVREPWVRKQLPDVEDRDNLDDYWIEVANDPGPLLSIEVCSAEWLKMALPALHEASEAPPFSGDDLLHNDVRSDNICIRPDGRACLIDWNFACRGNGLLDIAIWLPSLYSEGGPLPEEVSSEAGVFAPWLAGYFASRAPLPAPLSAPELRLLQQNMLRAALPWAARTLGLPPPV